LESRSAEELEDLVVLQTKLTEDVLQDLFNTNPCKRQVDTAEREPV
jgi:hypothetical protein